MWMPDLRRPWGRPRTESTPSLSNRRFHRLMVLGEQNRTALMVRCGPGFGGPLEHDQEYFGPGPGLELVRPGGRRVGRVAQGEGVPLRLVDPPLDSPGWHAGVGHQVDGGRPRGRA